MEIYVNKWIIYCLCILCVFALVLGFNAISAVNELKNNLGEVRDNQELLLGAIVDLQQKKVELDFVEPQEVDYEYLNDEINRKIDDKVTDINKRITMLSKRVETYDDNFGDEIRDIRDDIQDLEDDIDDLE